MGLGFGVEAGLGWLGQRFSEATTAPRNALVGVLAPVGQLEVALARRLVLRADAALLVYLASVGPAASGVSALVSWRAGLGLGVFV